MADVGEYYSAEFNAALEADRENRSFRSKCRRLMSKKSVLYALIGSIGIITVAGIGYFQFDSSPNDEMCDKDGNNELIMSSKRLLSMYSQRSTPELQKDLDTTKAKIKRLQQKLDSVYQERKAFFKLDADAAHEDLTTQERRLPGDPSSPRLLQYKKIIERQRALVDNINVGHRKMSDIEQKIGLIAKKIAAEEEKNFGAPRATRRRPQI